MQIINTTHLVISARRANFLNSMYCSELYITVDNIFQLKINKNKFEELRCGLHN